MLWEVVNTESAIKAEAALSQRASGLLMNPCVSWSKNAFSDSVVGFESLELLRNRSDQSPVSYTHLTLPTSGVV